MSSHARVKSATRAKVRIYANTFFFLSSFRPVTFVHALCTPVAARSETDARERRGTFVAIPSRLPPVQRNDASGDSRPARFSSVRGDRRRRRRRLGESAGTRRGRRTFFGTWLRHWLTKRKALERADWLRITAKRCLEGRRKI